MHLSFVWLIWIDAHWQALLAWVTGIFTLSKVGKFFARFAIAINNIFERFEKAEETLTLVATNHLPHMQSEMERMNDGIADLQSKTANGNDTLIEIATILRERD
jgi:hypothetical protein